VPSNLIYNENVLDTITDLRTATLTGSISAVEEYIAKLDPSSVGTYNAQVYTSLATSIFNGHVNVAEVLLTKTSLPVDFQGVTGNSALMFAAQWGQLEAVDYLLKAAADVALTNASGDTALSLAMKGGHREVAELLRSYGALV